MRPKNSFRVYSRFQFAISLSEASGIAPDSSSDVLRIFPGDPRIMSPGKFQGKVLNWKKKILGKACFQGEF